MSTATEKKMIVVVPFGVEIDTDRMGDQVLQNIPGCRLRSLILSMKPATDFKTGERVVPLGQAESMAMFPETPGQQIHVNPANLSYLITDPLRGNESLCKRIKKWMDRNGVYAAEERIDGVPDLAGTLDKHRMKGLCRELYVLIEAGQAKMVKGVKPDMKDIEQLPGNFLLNPGSDTPNSQPEFEKDFEAWRDRLARTGG